MSRQAKSKQYEIKAVLFDLDNTLTISEDFAAEVLSAAALDHGLDLSPEVILRYPGAVYVPLMQELAGIDERAAHRIYDRYVELYSTMMPGRLQPTLGAELLIADLAARGIPLALVTNKSRSLASAVLDLFGWTDAFTVVVGHDSSEAHKPHPAPALAALAALDCAPGHAAFVGDAVNDMLCGRDAGIPRLVALLGTTEADELVAAGATHVCADLREVLEALRASQLPDSATGSEAPPIPIV